MRHIPNILTVSRVLAAAALLFCRAFSVPFFCVYLYAGASDMLDGPLARRYAANGALGAKLDSVADLLFTAAVLYKIIPAVPWARWMLFWTAGIAAVRLLTLCVGLLKYRALPFLHTWSNKATGVLLFLFPLLYPALGLLLTAWMLGIVASLSSLEELAITLTSDRLHRDRKSLLISDANR